MPRYVTHTLKFCTQCHLPPVCPTYGSDSCVQQRISSQSETLDQKRISRSSSSRAWRDSFFSFPCCCVSFNTSFFRHRGQNFRVDIIFRFIDRQLRGFSKRQVDGGRYEGMLDTGLRLGRSCSRWRVFRFCYLLGEFRNV